MSSPRRLPLVLGLLLLFGALGWWLLPSDPASTPASVPPSAVRPSHPAATPPAELSPALPAPPATLADGSPIPTSVALDLNSPRFDITHDLNLVDALFTNWPRPVLATIEGDELQVWGVVTHSIHGHRPHA